MHITYQKFIIGILVIIIIIFAIKLYKTTRENNLENTNQIENFESVLNKLNTKKGKGKTKKGKGKKK